MSSAAIALCGMLVPMLTGVSYTDIIGINADSSAKELQAYKLLQMCLNLIMFAGTAFLYTYASHPDRAVYLGFRKIKRPSLVLFVVVLILANIPIILQLAHWITELDLNAAATKAHNDAQKQMEALMKVHTLPDVLLTLIVFAVVPAFGEELFFRGVLMRFIHKQTKNIHFAIFLSGAIFSFFHGQPYNMLSILIMGMLLGYIYYYSGSIWVSIIAHFLHNAVQIIMSFFAVNGIIAEGMETEDSFEWYVLVVAFAVAVGAFYLLKKKATPLPLGWSNDFSVEEQEHIDNEI